MYMYQTNVQYVQKWSVSLSYQILWSMIAYLKRQQWWIKGDVKTKPQSFSKQRAFMFCCYPKHFTIQLPFTLLAHTQNRRSQESNHQLCSWCLFASLAPETSVINIIILLKVFLKQWRQNHAMQVSYSAHARKYKLVYNNSTKLWFSCFCSTFFHS